MAVPTPLTTVFTPAASCLSEIHWGTASPWFQLGPGTQCIPSGPNPSLSSFYSPGLYCPQGYTIACSTEVTDGSATETRATCCPQPTGLGSLSVSPFACQVNSLFFATSYGCALGIGNLASNSLTVVATNSSTFLSTFSVGVLDAVNAYSVQIRWQQSDLRTSASESTTTSQSGSQSQAAGSTSSSLPVSTSVITSATDGSTKATATATAAAASGAGSSSTGLSTGAVIAIAVVIPVVVIAAIVAAFFLIRRKRRTQPAASIPQSSPTHELPAGTTGHTDMKDPYPSELDGQPRYEANSDTKEAVMKG